MTKTLVPVVFWSGVRKAAVCIKAQLRVLLIHSAEARF